MIKLATASKNEKGTFLVGEKGDQTGNEVYIRGYYSKPWDFRIRAKSQEVANSIATFMIAACNNNNIGYSQNDRNSLLLECIKTGYDAGAINAPCNCDCSSLVACAIISAGVDGTLFYNNDNCATTRTLRSACMNSKDFVIIPDANNETLNEHGDILLTEGKHVVVVIDTEYDANEVNSINTTSPKNCTYKFQKALIDDRFFDFPKYGADGIWGNECEDGFSRLFIRKNSPLHNTVRVIQEYLGIEVDGIFGSQTDVAVREYQSLHNLEVDGVVGICTIKSMLGV